MTAEGGIAGKFRGTRVGARQGAARSLPLAALLLIAVPATATVPVGPDTPAAPATGVAPAEKPLPDTPFVPPTHRLAAPPSSPADGVRALAQPSATEDWNAAWVRRGLSLREIVRVAAAEPWLLPMTLAGVGLIVIASFARRRQRRRIGWGVLPERGVRRERGEAGD